MRMSVIKHKLDHTGCETHVLASQAANNCRGGAFDSLVPAQFTLRLNHGLIRNAPEGVRGAELQMAQTTTDVRGDVRRYLFASIAGFCLGLTLGFLMMFGLA